MPKRVVKEEDVILEEHERKINKHVKEDSSPTGISDLDDLLGGGFPKGSVTLLSGSSGSGKTIFAFQWLFEGAKNGENGVYITLTEPLFKSLKNLETMNFYDRKIIESEKIKIIDIRDTVENKELYVEKLCNYIEETVKKCQAKRLCIDSVTAIGYNIQDKSKIRSFIFELGKILATLGCTTVLTSEIGAKDKYSVFGVEEFISDAIVRLDQVKFKSELQRMMQIVKVRGRRYKTDDLYFRISDAGITVFPPIKISLEHPSSAEKTTTGVLGLDEMTNGGFFIGSSTLVAGPTGGGKTMLSISFLNEGLKKGESCLYIGFEESKDQILRNAKSFGWDLEPYIKSGAFTLMCVYPAEKLIEEHLIDIRKVVKNKKIKRCVVDSLSILKSDYRDEIFQSFMKRLNAYLKSESVTSLYTTVLDNTSTTFTSEHMSAIVDSLIVMRYAEIQGEMKQILHVVKMRGSGHSKKLRMYEITKEGFIIGPYMVGYEGVTTGVTRKVSETVEERILLEFKKFLGPVANTIFKELHHKGLSHELVDEYINDLEKQKILSKQSSETFKRNIDAIFSGSTEIEETETEAKKDERNLLEKILISNKKK